MTRFQLFLYLVAITIGNFATQNEEIELRRPQVPKECTIFESCAYMEMMCELTNERSDIKYRYYRCFYLSSLDIKKYKELEYLKKAFRKMDSIWCTYVKAKCNHLTGQEKFDAIDGFGESLQECDALRYAVAEHYADMHEYPFPYTVKTEKEAYAVMDKLTVGYEQEGAAIRECLEAYCLDQRKNNK